MPTGCRSMSASGAERPPADQLVRVTLGNAGTAHGAAELARERQLAVQDLLECNQFAPENGPPGPYAAEISLQGERMVFMITPVETASDPFRVAVPVADLTGLVRDYHAICQSYYDALQRASVGKIEAIDMGRRALHDEGAGLLADCLKGRIRTDFDTARRLFTLLSVLFLTADMRFVPIRLSPRPGAR